MKNGQWPPAEKRFWSRVDKTDKCWNWTGANVKGRGQIWVDGKSVLAYNNAETRATLEVEALSLAALPIEEGAE